MVAAPAEVPANRGHSKEAGTNLMSLPRRTLLSVIAGLATAAALLMLSALHPAGAGADTLGQLNGQLSHEQAHQQSLSSSISSLDHLISGLTAQIALVQSREAAVHQELEQDKAALDRVQYELTAEKKLLAKLRARLAAAQQQLSVQLVSGYESAKPDLVTVVLNADGFNQLLDQLAYLGKAEKAQQTLITAIREARAAADAAARHLAALQAADRRITHETYVRDRALKGMNALLSTKQEALRKARGAQQAALAASRAHSTHLQSQISKIQSQQAAAEQAAFAVGPALGPSGGWAIPYPIVLCESGGQNMTPNSAGASGYYQIIPSTWTGFGGSGPAAYLTSKAEQDAVASRIWRGGAGASNWVCAGIVGIH
jgi:septal ring factor EnvC (AmiA/AmiB activator)